MKVVLLSITFEPEPGAIRGLPLARWLKQKGGFDVKVLTAFPWYPLGKIYPKYRMRPWQWENIDGIPVLRVPIYPSHGSSAIKRILTYMSFMISAATIGIYKIGKVDMVYYFDNLPTTGLVARFMQVFRGAATVQHIADMWPDTVVESGMIRNRLLLKYVEKVLSAICNYLYKTHKSITVLSPGFKQILVERGIDPSKIHVIYNWADEDRFYPAIPETSLAKKIGFEGYFNIVYAGNIGSLQALDILIRAAALIRQHKNIQIVIVGTGPQMEQLKRLSEELKTANVKFLGNFPLDEMNKLNALADVLFVHLRDIPFMHATIPSKIQVALASGRPILIGVKGDAAEIVRNAQAGIIFESENPIDLAKAIVRLSEMTKDEINAMGRRGRAFYEQYLSLDIGAMKTEEIFRDIFFRKHD